MIPRHRPPFGLLSLTNSAVRSLFDRRRICDVEQAYADRLEVDYVVWVPSARYGIARTIDAGLPQNGSVYCPTFNCGAVFHAAQECHRAISFVDCADNSFLIDTTKQPQPGSAVILSEMFGHRFSTARLSQPLAANADTRIFDMAMCVPNAADMRRMQNQDVTVLSFGLGKSLYAGWGGLAVTLSQEVADNLRQQRDRDLQNTGLIRRSIWHAKLWARTAAHHPSVYGWLRKSRRRSSATASDARFSNTSAEWQRESTLLNRRLAFDNLRRADSWGVQRQKLTDRYFQQLQPIADLVQQPDQSTDAPSHFCIRIPAASRGAVIQQLWDCGIDVGSLFPFPGHFCTPNEFPNAAQASAEVINLPLSNQLSVADVNDICEVLKMAIVSRNGAEGRATEKRAA